MIGALHCDANPFDMPFMRATSCARTLLQAFASGVSQLRVDVELPEQDLEQELDALYARWISRGSGLTQVDDLHLPGHALTFWMREADGEYFIYVVDPARNRLAAYIVMSRLIELDRRADRHLRSPHSKVAADYRRMGSRRRFIDGGWHRAEA